MHGGLSIFGALAIAADERRIAVRLLVVLRLSAEEGERFLSAQADGFAGANAEEKVGLLRSK
jgi:hypothetical protein